MRYLCTPISIYAHAQHAYNGRATDKMLMTSSHPASVIRRSTEANWILIQRNFLRCARLENAASRQCGRSVSCITRQVKCICARCKDPNGLSNLIERYNKLTYGKSFGCTRVPTWCAKQRAHSLHKHTHTLADIHAQHTNRSGGKWVMAQRFKMKPRVHTICRCYSFQMHTAASLHNIYNTI